MMFEGAKLLATSMSAVVWYKSRAHISFPSEVIQIMCQLNVNKVCIGNKVSKASAISID